jgi:TolB protein
MSKINLGAMKNVLGILFLSIVMLYNNVVSATNTQVIEITKGRADPVPIAINQFKTNSGANNLSQKILGVVADDLINSGIFRTINEKAFIEKKVGIEHTPLYASWRQIGASMLLNGEIKKIENKKYEVSFILWDTFLNKAVVGSSFEVNEKLWRRVAHKIADKIYEKLTGQKGYFDTKIVYISETASGNKKIKRLALMDYDGANHRFLTDGKFLVLTPRLSPDGTKVLYLSYEKRVPKVFIMDLNTGRHKLVGHFVGLSFAPRFSPDGRKAIMSIAKNGATNLYEVDMKSFMIKQLTYNFAINTSPSYSPDGKKIVYNSNISGQRHLYIMDTDGSNATRISFGNGAYACPVWSPRGDLIAFTRITQSEGFTINVMRIDGSGERMLSRGYLVESPSWSPNGAVIAYTKFNYPVKKQPNLPYLYSIDISGYNEMRLNTPKFGSSPEWSYLLD